MQRLLMFLVLLLMLMAAILVAMPLFIDTGSYKEDLEGIIKKSTGLDAQINGKISISLLPEPVIEFENISVPNFEGAISANIIHVTKLKIMPSIKSMVKGQFDIQDVEFVEPTVEIEKISDLETNWNIIRDAYSKKQLPEGFTFPDSVTVTNGIIAYRDKENRSSIDYISAEIDADSLEGPFSISGDFSKNEQVIEFEGKLGKLVNESPASFKLVSENLKINMIGKYKLGEPYPFIEGDISGETSDLSSLAKMLAEHNYLIANIRSEEGLKTSGKFLLSKRLFKLMDVNILADSLSGKINAEMLLNEKIDAMQWDFDTKFNKVDFDKLFKLTEIEDENPNKSSIDYYSNSLRRATLSDYNFDIPDSLNAIVRMDVGEIKYKNQLITNLKIDADIFNGKAAINDFSASLPANAYLKFSGEIEHNGIRPLLKGRLISSGRSFSGILKWLVGEKLSYAQADIGDYLLSAQLKMTPQKIAISEIDLLAGNSSLNGSLICYPARSIPMIKLNMKVEKLNLDNYGFTAALQDSFSEFLQKARGINLESSWLKLMNMDIEFNFEAKDIFYNKNLINKFVLSSSLQRGVFALQKIFIDAEKAKLESSLLVNLQGEVPTINLDVKSSYLDTGFFVVHAKPEAKWSWSNDNFNFLGLEKFYGNITVAIEQLKYKKLDLNKLVFEADLKNKVLNVNKATADLYGGKAVIKGAVGVSESNPSFGVSYFLSKVDAGDFALIFSDDFKTGGKIQVSGTAKSFGKTPAMWVSQLVLSDGKFDARKILINNFDLRSIISNSIKTYSVIDMDGIVKKAIANGTTVFDSVGGVFSAANGILSLQNMNLVTKNSRGVFAGNINLLSGEMKGVAKIGFKPEANRDVVLGVNIDGSISNINRSIDTGQLDAYITSKGR